MDTPESRRKLLVEALRSGEYKQGTGRLSRDQNGVRQYCCLGVACMVYQKHVGDLKIDTDGPVHSYDTDVHGLPEKVQEWYGFDTRCGRLKETARIAYGYNSLLLLNDSGYSFREIADVIEQEKV